MHSLRNLTNRLYFVLLFLNVAATSFWFSGWFYHAFSRFHQRKSQENQLIRKLRPNYNNHNKKYTRHLGRESKQNKTEIYSTFATFNACVPLLLLLYDVAAITITRKHKTQREWRWWNTEENKSVDKSLDTFNFYCVDMRMISGTKSLQKVEGRRMCNRILAEAKCQRNVVFMGGFFVVDSLPLDINNKYRCHACSMKFGTAQFIAWKLNVDYKLLCVLLKGIGEDNAKGHK